MTLRSPRERLIQTLAFEAGGLLLVTPLYALTVGNGTGSSISVTLALSMQTLLWAPLFNHACDWLELRFRKRVASQRPERMRLLHAFLFEFSEIIISTPLIMWIGGHGFWEALLIDFGFTFFYTAYAYVFHKVFDWLRPVAAAHTANTSAKPATNGVGIPAFAPARDRPAEMSTRLARLEAENADLRHLLGQTLADLAVLRDAVTARHEPLHDNWGHLRERGRM